ncbi:hypothetical protein PQX77_022378 [Marasmius sp. AFHP31]|nr:hypothetical protein PQX77_022378 [Marasmius sp. AFHP31]
MALSTWLLAATTLATHAHAYFLMGANNPLTTERIDPIVYPGQVASHVHTVFGGSNFRLLTNSTESLRQSECSSVPIMEDKSNYWVPFRMLSGDPSLRTYDPTSYAQQAITYLCLDFNGVTTRHNELPRGKRCPSGIRAQVNFPMCWDGKNVDSPDHKSHVAFPSGGPDSGKCEDPKYPKTLPRIFLEMYWGTPDFNNLWGDAMDGDQPFVFANGDPTGYGYHGDFFNGWDKGVLQKAVDTCHCDPNGSLDCCAQQGVFTLNKDRKCKITKEVDEITTGTLPKLPGSNPVTKQAPGASGPEPGQPQILEPVYVYYGDQPDKVGVPVSGSSGGYGNANGQQGQTAGATEATSTSSSQGSGSTSSPAGSQSQSGQSGGDGAGKDNNSNAGGASGSAGGGYGSSSPAGSQSGGNANGNSNAGQGGYGSTGSNSNSGEVLTQNPPTSPPAQQQGTNNSGSGAYGNQNQNAADGVGDDDSNSGHGNLNNDGGSRTCGRKSKRRAVSKKRERAFHRRRHNFESNQF